MCVFLPLKRGSSEESLKELSLRAGQQDQWAAWAGKRGRISELWAWNVLDSRPQGQWELSAESGMLG